MHENLVDVIEKINRKLVGMYAYYGINGMFKDLLGLYKYIKYGLYKVIYRRSQKKINAKKYMLILERISIAKPKIYVQIWKSLKNYMKSRMREKCTYGSVRGNKTNHLTIIKYLIERRKVELVYLTKIMKRLKNIDFLKTIGLMCIILAHVVTNGIIFQLRNFDVVLMIMLSSYLYIIKNDGKSQINIKYLIKRVKRLLLPTWFFLIIFFVFSYIFVQYDLKTIISSFLLHNGIGYVWIIRIYLIVAIILPILVPLLKEKKQIHIYIVDLYIIYELLAQAKIFNNNIFISDVVAYIIPIVLIITTTYWIMNNDNKKISIFCFINFCVFIISLIIIYKITGEIQNTNYMKYPFRVYYLSYAFFASSILIMIFRNEKINNLLYNKLIEFISKSSLWIYLHHIYFVVLFNNVCPNLNKFIEYFCIIFLSIGITYVQNRIIDMLEKKGANKEILKVFRG